MKIREAVEYLYEIDDDILIEYIERCKRESIKPSFKDFMDWLQDHFYLSDFEKDIEGNWKSINGSTNIDAEFLKEIERLK